MGFDIVSFLILFGLLIIAMSVHEFAHAFTAYKLGDATAKYSGRLTFNPLAHIDIFWTVLLPLVIFISTGYFIAAAKPVPINYWALKNPKRDMVLIGASGCAANFILAILLALLLKVTHYPILNFLLVKLIYINVILGVFNLVPIPPLDGSRVLMGILPEELARPYASLEPYGFFIVMILFALGLISRLVVPIINLIMSLLIPVA